MRPSRTRARELHLLAFVRAYAAVRGVAPVYAEIADELRVSVPFIHKLVCRLEASGEVACLWVSGHRSPRSIRVTNSAAPRGSHSTPATGDTTMTMMIPTPANIAAAARDDAASLTDAARALADYQARAPEAAIYSVDTFGAGTLEDRARALGKLESAGAAGGPMVLGPRRVPAPPPPSTEAPPPAPTSGEGG